MAVSDLGELLQTTLDQLLTRLGATASVTVTPTERGWRADIESPDSSLLIGWRGGSLIALEYVTRLLIYRAYPADADLPEIQVDIEGYKQRQIDELITVARKAAATVRETAAPKILRPMNAFERRIIHAALTDEPGVTTESIGTDPSRRIMIKSAA